MIKNKAGITTVCIVVITIILMLKGCSQHKEFLKSNAVEKWAEQGFEVIAYEGWQFGFGFVGTKYGSAKVWHRLRKIPDNGITYSGFLLRWGNEIHVYGPNAAEAIPPK